MFSTSDVEQKCPDEARFIDTFLWIVSAIVINCRSASIPVTSPRISDCLTIILI